MHAAQSIVTLQSLSRAVEMGFKTRVFTKKTKKTQKFKFCFFSSFTKTFKNPDFRLTVTAENVAFQSI